MTPEERQMLTDLANKIAQTPAPPIDAEAEEFIRTRVGSRPDALYLMTQTVLIQNMALEHARQQIQQLQQGQAPAATGSSFLGSQQPAQPVAPSPSQASYSAPASAYQPVPASGPGGSSSGGSSFLKSAAQTAAGVAAGALAFEGIRSLFGGIGHMGGLGGGSGFFGGGGIGGYAPAGETVINNYYDSPEQDASSNDVDDRDDNSQGDNSQFDDADYQDSSDDSDFSDDSSGDDFLA